MPVSVAVGNTSVEALTALISSQAGGAGTIDSELLEAFQLNALDVLDRPDGSAVLAEKLRASFFQRRIGGYAWNIVDAPNTTTSLPQEELLQEAKWLAALNLNQQAVDAAQLELLSLQRQLYVLWWKYENYNLNSVESPYNHCLKHKRNLANQLDPTISGSLAQQVMQQQALVGTLLAQVPNGATPDELEQSILAYSTAQQLPATRLLKRLSGTTFYLPNNPVVLIAGAGASGIVQPPDTIQCRFPSQVVAGFDFFGTSIIPQTAGLTIPQPQLSGVTGVPWLAALAGSLVNEFFFLDPNNAYSVAIAMNADPGIVLAEMSNPANDLGTYPTGGVEQWTANPWHPLLIFWQASYYPITYGAPGTPNWIFQGSQYTWNQSLAAVSAPPLGLQGVIQLTPSAAFNMESRLQQFLNNNPNLPANEDEALKNLLQFVQKSDEWDLLSQQLDGFNEQLLLGAPGVFLSPQASSLVTTPPGVSDRQRGFLSASTGQYPGTEDPPQPVPALARRPVRVPQPHPGGRVGAGAVAVQP